MIPMSSGDIFENPIYSMGPNKQMLVQREGYTVIRISLRKGGKIPPHIANHSAFFMVLKGRAVITSGDQDLELEENQYLALEANQMRGIHALEDLILLGIRD